ncbi:hypothetical protein ABZ135_16945 [Streptomyces sp. NPDC006339]|uniref:hypothetical protein n=1 Tax=Streptomyces sp. NPDC006339 TaxID=3156755 RepID=UPI0033BC0525
MSPAKLRGLGLGAAVVIAVLVPIAASAGPTAERAGESSGASGASGTSGASGAADDAKPKELLSDLDLGDHRPGDSRPASPASPASPAAPAFPPSAASEGEAQAAPLPSATRCGPELASPDGVEAQTCVVTEGADTWARTYYRNTTGQELDAVLTLMAPGGRTVQVRCAVEARDEPGTCETPRERGRGAAEAYSAVSEFAGAGEDGEAPLLLRSGSNAPESDGI